MKINVLVPWTPGDGIKEYWLRINDKLKKYVDTRSIKNTNPSSLNPFYFIKLAEESKNCDLLHVQHNYCLFGVLFNKLNSVYAWLYYLLAKVPNGPKIITTVHDIVEPRKLKFYERAYLDFMNLPLKMFSERIIVHNEKTRDQLVRQGFKDEIIVTIPSGLDEHKPTKSKKEMRKKLRVPERKTIILFGWVRPDKQFEKVIAVLDRLKGMQALVIGGYHPEDEGYFNSLKEEVKKRKLIDRVIFTGLVSEERKWELISCGDVAVLPYSRITNSAALNDVLSAHLPTVTSRLPEFEDVNKGYNVIKMVNVDSQKELVTAIQHAVDHPETSLKSIHKYIHDNSREVVAQKTKKVYDEVLQGKQ